MSGSCLAATAAQAGADIFKRQDADPLRTFLGLVQSPFKSQFATDTFFASLGSSLGVSTAILLAFCIVRPLNSVVYAPKLRHSDEKHAPPRINKGIFSWLSPLFKCHEADLVDKLGLDAIVFLRFLRMCRTIFFFLALIGCLVMIPVNVTCNRKAKWALDAGYLKNWFVAMTPQFAWNDCMWAHVIVTWVFDFIIMYFLWTNYKAVMLLRKSYFESPEYQNSLHSRTLMISDVPSTYRSDAGLNQLIDGLPVPKHGDEKYAIGRNVKDLPELIEQHAEAVRKLEGYLSSYLKNPDHLPANRPVCKPDKKDKSIDPKAKVDAIEYLGQRIRDLEAKIYAVRDSVDNRDAMPYGFVSYPTISRAHITAKAARGKHPKGTTITVAPRPNDIIWSNLGRSKSSRRWNGFIGNFLFVLLSVLFVVPNALIAVFLSNLHNIAAVYPRFGTTMSLHPTIFAIVQGFATPTITSIIYLVLPIIMRRISIWQGDLTKTSRERHVTHKLYIFFVFNNLIVFTLFGTMWTLIQTLIDISGKTAITWDVIKQLAFATKVVVSAFDVSTFWITYLLQRNLGAMLDLAQLVSLLGKTFSRHFMSPTPRQMIEWTAPPVFDYASYYNYFLFYTTIALVFATIQPIVLVVACFYFTLDSFLKKYTLMYIFVTKIESGGAFWRLLFNRFIFATGLFNFIVAMVVWVRHTKQAAACIIPLFIILIGFKIYCGRTFDPQMRYHTKGSDRESMIDAGKGQRKDNLGKRFGHPALYRSLITPMVHAKARNVLQQVYSGRINSEPTHRSTTYGDIDMDAMQSGRGNVGRRIDPLRGQFEFAEEGDLDFTNYKHRAEFGADHGAGSIYGAASVYGDAFTPPPGFGSPASSRPGSPSSGRAGPSSLRIPLTGYRGAEYAPVNRYDPNNNGPPSPGGLRPHSGHSNGPYLGDHDDSRSETESLTHLLREPVAPGISHGSFGRQQQYQETSYESFRGR